MTFWESLSKYPILFLVYVSVCLSLWFSSCFFFFLSLLGELLLVSISLTCKSCKVLYSHLIFLNKHIRHIPQHNCHGLPCRKVGRSLQKQYRWCGSVSSVLKNVLYLLVHPTVYLTINCFYKLDLITGSKRKYCHFSLSHMLLFSFQIFRFEA